MALDIMLSFIAGTVAICRYLFLPYLYIIPLIINGRRNHTMNNLVLLYGKLNNCSSVFISNKGAVQGSLISIMQYFYECMVAVSADGMEGG